ncbi:MAG TPA: hypothetical protein VJU15_16160 [Gemmatimonadales bacterium]|nr:hypothetical protein [Gemmatimonadales bacterium]
MSRESRFPSREIPPEWGAVYDGHTLSLSLLRPSGIMSLERARFGRTVIDLRAKSRPGGITVQLGVRFGPPLPVEVQLRGVEVWQVLVDENAIEGTRAALVASHEHEIQFLAASS